MDLKERLSAALAGRYEIEREIGRGGMAVVYLARDLKLDRRVALKVLRPEFTASLIADRFVQEIQIAARLEHPLILKLYESDSSDGLLWYAMPYIKGETLHDRLRRERQLPIDEAVRITCGVAEALSYAHGQGVIHRDIKPANILFSDGHPLVADFGIAKAFTEAGGPTHTATAVGIGTPGYMSPEQATGEKNIDPRTDVYSLACVLYEMLAGETPYTGPTAQAIIAKQLSLAVPSVCTVRDTVPPALDEALRRALAKVPADRYATVADFSEAVQEAAQTRPPGLWDAVRRVVGRKESVAVGGAAAVTALVWVVVSGQLMGNADGALPDSTRYAILPFEYQPGADTPLNEEQLLYDALSRWSGLSITDASRVREGLGGREPTALTHSAATQLVSRIGAGRYIRGSVARVGDSVRIQVGLYDARASGTRLADEAVRIPLDLTGLEAQFDSLADRLLFRGPLPDTAGALWGTRSLPARQAFIRGERALRTWNLIEADSAFTDAARFDAAYAQAHLWVALARMWSGAVLAKWRVAAEQAALRRAQLSPRDQTLADAVLVQARDSVGGEACSVWERLTNLAPRDYAAWYGAAHCLRHDSVVVRDPLSPSDWRFRSSYQAAIRAYRRAFELQPAILSSLRGNSYQTARALLMTSTRQVRPGRAIPPDTSRFGARPVWTGDSVLLLPYPFALTQRPIGPWKVDSVRIAVDRQRALFHEIALTWLTAFPRSAAAMEALSVSLEMLGNPAAVDSLRRARELAMTPGEQASAATAEVWLQVKLGVPSNPARLSSAKALADSLLRDSSAAAHAPHGLASVAALTGRAVLSSTLFQRAAAQDGMIPGPLATSAHALLVLASLGGPIDSLPVLEGRVAQHLDDSSLPDREVLRLEWLGRPARLAAHVLPFRTANQLRGRGSVLLDAQAALVDGDTATVRRVMDHLRTARRSIPPAERAIDALYPEAVLVSQVHGEPAAIEWLDPTLNALDQVAPGTFYDLARPGALVNALALRADLASRTGDHVGARRWAGAVVILWSDADAFLQPVVARMRRLANP